MKHSLRPGALAAAAASGALLGLTFTVAEVATGYLAGGRFSVRFWVFLAAYSVPALAVLGLAAQAGRALRKDPTSAWDPGATGGILFFIYTAAAVNHQFLTAYPFLSATRLVSVLVVAAGAILVFRTLAAYARERPFDFRVGLLGFVVMPLLLTVATWLAVTTLQPLGAGVAALCFVPMTTAGVLAGWHLATRLLPPDASARRIGLGGLLVGIVVAGLLARGLRDSRDAAPFSRAEPQPPAGAKGPNVVLVVLDTVRAANLSAYGYPRRTTPQLDAFARMAVRYQRHLAPSSWSLPGHASLFTGLLPSHHGADGPALEDVRPVEVGHALGAEFDTLAELLSRQGYATAGIVSNFAIVGRAFGLDQGFRYYDATPSSDFLRLPFPPLLSRIQGRIPERLLPLKQADWFLTACRPAEEITDRALRWLAERRRGQPFLLFVNYMDAHDYTPRGRFRDLWPGRSPKGQAIFRGLGGVVAGQRDITLEEKEHVTALYDGSLSYLDEHLGRLLSALETDPEYEDTWVVITSDHGESLGEHRTLQHQCSLYQEILWTPLIVRYPAHAVAMWGDEVHPGGVDTRLVQSTDVLPTLLDGSGLPVPSGLDGRPIHEGRETAVAEYFVNQELAREVPEIGRREMKALVEGDWKLIETRRESAGPSRQFFNLRRDRGEWHDLAWAGPLDMERLAGILATLVSTKETAPGRAKRAQPMLTEEQREVLRAVGYLR